MINGRGIVQYNFEATVDEELTVDRGEQVIIIPSLCGHDLAIPCIPCLNTMPSFPQFTIAVVIDMLLWVGS